MSTEFINPQYQSILNLHQLDSFQTLWDAKVDWFEAPNERRGGWSGVGLLRLKSEAGPEVVLFVKKQQNHGRRTLLHPIAGEPTFRREFGNLQFLAEKQFTAPKVVFYGEDANTKRAILATVALSDYQSLDEWMHPNYRQLSNADQTEFLTQLAQSIRRFHDLGMVHRALYPKHIFIHKQKPTHEVAVIDLEKARLTRCGWYRTYFDLAALFRHATWWSQGEQLTFFKAYCVKSELNSYEQRLFRKILKRASR